MAGMMGEVNTGRTFRFERRRDAPASSPRTKRGMIVIDEMDAKGEDGWWE
jgi:hypothetical protein